MLNFTSLSSAADNPQRVAYRLLQKTLLDTTGHIAMFSDSDPDPLDSTGFLELEGALNKELVTVTAPARDEAQQQVDELVSKTDWKADSRTAFAGLLAAMWLILQPYAVATRAASDPITVAGMTNIAASTGDSWARLLGEDVPPLPHERRVLDRLVVQPGLFVEDYMGATLQGNFRSRMLRAVSLYGSNVDAIADDLTAYADGLVGNTKGYWANYSTSVLNRARNFASIVQFQRRQYRYAVYSNPMDNRTTPFCASIEGLEVRVSVLVQYITRISELTTPGAIRAAAPWVASNTDGSYTVGGTTFTTEQITAQYLEALNVLCPPFHGFCRTLLLPA